MQGALAGSAPPATLALTTAHHGLAPPTTCYGATLGVLGTLSSAGSGMRQRHLVAGVVGGGGAGGVHGRRQGHDHEVPQGRLHASPAHPKASYGCS